MWIRQITTLAALLVSLDLLLEEFRAAIEDTCSMSVPLTGDTRRLRESKTLRAIILRSNCAWRRKECQCLSIRLRQ